MDEKTMSNPMGSEKIGKLLLKFSIPCVLSLLITALYNIVDQIFIGRGVGYWNGAGAYTAGEAGGFGRIRKGHSPQSTLQTPQNMPCSPHPPRRIRLTDFST